MFYCLNWDFVLDRFNARVGESPILTYVAEYGIEFNESAFENSQNDGSTDHYHDAETVRVCITEVKHSTIS